MLCTQIVVLVQNNFGTQHVLKMLRASEKDLPVQQKKNYPTLRESI